MLMSADRNMVSCAGAIVKKNRQSAGSPYNVGLKLYEVLVEG